MEIKFELRIAGNGFHLNREAAEDTCKALVGSENLLALLVTATTAYTEQNGAKSALLAESADHVTGVWAIVA